METTSSWTGRMILLVTILASGMAFLDGTVVNIAIPVIQQKFSAELAGIQWVVNSYLLILSALIIISGSLGDHFGRKKIFGIGIGFFAIASLLCAFSANINQLILFRSLQGLGGAMMIPGSLSIINSTFQSEVRGRVIGLWSGFAGGIAALGPFLGGWLVEVFGWESIFLINLPLAAIALTLLLRFVPESKDIKAGKLNFVSPVLLFFSLLAITYGLISGPENNWNPFAIVTLFFGIAFFILFIIFEKKSETPLIPFEIFRSSLVVGANLVTLFLYFALSGVIFFLVLNLQQVQHFSPIFAGLGMLPAILIITFLSVYGGALADKIGPRKPMIIGPLVVSLGMFLIAFSGRNANYFTQIMPGLILFGLGMAFVIAPLTKSALAVDERFSGSASGVNNAVARIAGVLAIAILGGIMLFTFSHKLTTEVEKSNLNKKTRYEIIVQQNKLAAISPPEGVNGEEKKVITDLIEEAFINGFRWVMIINALLALTSSIVSFKTIKES